MSDDEPRSEAPRPDQAHAVPHADRDQLREAARAAVGEAEEAPVAREGVDVEPAAHRPLIERVGLAAIALVLAALFGAVALAAASGGEIFLAAMGAIGCLMTLWVGALTLFRG